MFRLDSVLSAQSVCSVGTSGNVDTWGHVRAGHYIIVTIISARHVVARTEDGGEIGDTLITFVLHTDNTPGTQGDTGNLEICALEI